MSPRIASWVVHRPWRVIALSALVAIAAFPLAVRLRLDTNIVDLLPGRAPAAASFARYSRLFAAEQALVIVVESADPVRLIDFADRYAEALRAAPEIVEVRARFSSETTDRIRRHLFDLLEVEEIRALGQRTTPEGLRAQARRLRSLISAPGGGALAPLLTADPLELLGVIGGRLQPSLSVDTRSGYLKSADGRALLLFARPRSDPFDIDADRRLLDGAERAARSLGAEVVSEFSPHGDAVQVGFTGAYAYALGYRDDLHRDMQLSTTISAVAVLLLFALLLGAIRALPVVAVPLLFSLWITAAVAGGLYGRVNAVSLAFGTILLAIGIDLPIQIYNRLRSELQAAPPREALQRTIASLAGPSLLATVGPAAVFLCCALSEYRGLSELGALAAIGLLINYVMMVTLLPSLLSVVPARLWAPSSPPPDGLLFAAIGRFSTRRPRILLAVAAVIVMAGIPFALRLRFDRHLVSIEPPDMAAARVAREVERHFGERRRMLIALSESIDPQEALERAERWREEAERLRAEGVVSSYESITTLFPSLSEQQRRRAELAKLDPRRVAADLERALDEAGFDRAAFEPFLRQLVEPGPPIALEEAGSELAFLVRTHVHDEPGRRVVATFLTPTPGQLDEAAAALDRFANRQGDVLTGLPLLEEALYRIVRRDTVRVSIASILVITALLVVYYRRVRPVVAVALPLVGVWVLFAAALGAADIPITLFNLLSIPLIVGYGIDDHVFLVHRFDEDPSAGPERPLQTTGRAIVVTSLSTMAGFAGLAVARFDGLRLLGLSGVIAVGLSLFAAIAILPALLAILRPSSDDRPGGKW